MSGKPGKQQQPQQKRKADGAEGAKAPAAKKAKDNAGAAAAPAAAEKKKPQQQQQGGNKQPQAKKDEGKKGKKAPEPELEEEDAEDDGEDEDDLVLGSGQPNPEAIAAADAVQEEMDKVATQLDELDSQQSAEIFAVQKKFLLQKRPVLAKRDALMAKVPLLWKTLLSEHEVFVVQLEEVDMEILDHLTVVEISENYSKPSDPKQQIVSVDITFTFSAGSTHVKAGKFKKTFAFDDEKETLQCVATPAAGLPWVNAAQFSKENGDSFFGAWFSSEGDDEGILRAQDALSSELYVDPLQLFRHVSEGGNLSDITGGGDDDDEDDLAMAFGEDGEEDSDDEDAPELADD
jgi:hypothetical protein